MSPNPSAMYSNTEKSQSSTVIEGPESPTDSKSSTMPPDVQACPSPVDFGRTIEPPSLKTRLNDAWWTLELVSMFLAVLSFTVWLVLLSQSHTYEVLARESVLKGPFTYLPSMAGLLMSILRITMLFPVSAAMGQLKWQYFRRPGSRPVSDLKAFDDASRGLFGSFKLLTSKNGGHSLSVGCFLIIGALFLESMAQNAIRPDRRDRWYNITSSVPDETTFDGKALLPYTRHYDRSIPMITDHGLMEVNASPSMQAAIYTAWSNYETKQFRKPQINSLPINCSEDACRWPKISTLATYYKCQPAPTAQDSDGYTYSTQANITNRLSVDGPHGRETHRSRIHLESSPTIPPQSSFANLINNPGIIMHIAALARNPENLEWEAVECILFWEVRLILETVFNTTTDTIEHLPVQSAELAGITTDDKEGNISIPALCVDGDNESECRYSVTNNAHTGIQNFLVRMIAGSVYTQKVGDPESHMLVTPDTMVLRLFASSLHGVDFHHPSPLKPTLEKYLHHLTAAIGHEMRTVSGTNISGEVHVVEPYFNIYWRFALYPGMMLLFSMCFVFVTMWRTWKLPVWKTSPLPMLYHGFDRPVCGGQYDLTNLAWMTQVSKKTEVRLQDREDGVGLKLRVA